MLFQTVQKINKIIVMFKILFQIPNQELEQLKANLLSPKKMKNQ